MIKTLNFASQGNESKGSNSRRPTNRYSYFIDL